MADKIGTKVRGLSQHMTAAATLVRKHMRLSFFFIGGAVIAAGAWLLSASASEPAPTRPQMHTSQESTMQAEPGGGNDMLNSRSPDQTNTIENRTTVESNNQGTTVTVNGEQESLGPNESLNKTYTSNTENGSSRVDVSVENKTETNGNTETSSRGSSVHVRMHSSSQSSAR